MTDSRIAPAKPAEPPTPPDYGPCATVAERLAHGRLARAYASLALEPKRLAGLLCGHLAPGWAPSAGYACGPCPGGCATDAARAYAVQGWSPWVRCWRCGLDETVRELLTMRVGERVAVRAIMQAANESAPCIEVAYPDALCDALEAHFDRHGLLGTAALHSVVIDAEIRASKASGRPMLVLDLGLWTGDRWGRGVLYAPCQIALYHSTLKALRMAPTEPERLVVAELVGRDCIAHVRSEASPLGQRASIAYLDALDGEPTPGPKRVLARRTIAPADELASARWLIDIAAASRIITEPLDATIIDTIAVGEPDLSQRTELRLRVDRAGWAGPETLRWRPTQAAYQALLTLTGSPHTLKGVRVAARITRTDSGRVEILSALPDRSPVAV